MKNEDSMTAAELIAHWLEQEEKAEEAAKEFAGDKVVIALFIDTLYALELADEEDRLYIHGFY